MNAHHYKQLSLNVREQLGFNIPSHQIQSFTLWLFIMDYSIKSQHQLETLSSDDLNVVFQTIYPDKPESLSHWHLHEWYYFCLTNSINGVFNERSLIDLSVFEEAIINQYDLWIDLFTQEYKPLIEDERYHIKYKLIQIILLTKFINVDETSAELIIRSDNIEASFQSQFTQRFEMFWDKYLKLDKPYDNSMFKFMSKLIIRNQFLIDEVMTHVFVHLRLSGGTLITKYIEALIQQKFSNDYKLHFVSRSHQADLIITSSTYKGPKDKSLVFISDFLGDADFERIKLALEDIKKFKDI